jgi:hypothetical protein
LRVRNKNHQDQQRNDFEHTQRDNDNRNTHVRSTLATTREIRNKIDNVQYFVTCNEWIPAMTIIQEECRRCHTEKPLPNLPKRFSAKNDMDPGKVPEEL